MTLATRCKRARNRCVMLSMAWMLSWNEGVDVCVSACACVSVSGDVRLSPCVAVSIAARLSASFRVPYDVSSYSSG